jgi:DNA-binding IclR family transcriptional regulator
VTERSGGQPAPSRGPEGVRAVERAMSILFALAASPEGITLADLSRTTGISIPTAHRLIAALRTHRLVRETQTGLQSLGPGSLILARGFLGGLDFRVEALPILSELRDATSETCHLGTFASPHVVYVDKLDSTHSVRTVSRIGATVPAVTTALGRSILAYSDEQAVVAVIEASKAQLAITVDADQFRQELKKTRARGYGLDIEQNQKGICCVGAPVFNQTADVIAGISVTFPSARFDKGRAGEMGLLVRASADRISEALGFPHGRRNAAIL